MRPVKSYIRTILNESLLDDDDIFYSPENDKKEIEKWIRNNYNIVGKLTISDDFVVDCSGDVTIKNRNMESLTNGLFRWGAVGYFSCRNCKKITSLEGAPEEVKMGFYCTGCIGLESLEGSPKKVGGSFYCGYCNKLTTLEGAPKDVRRDFDCTGCENLKSLEGAPKEVGKNFDCTGCDKLTSLEGSPKKVAGYFNCSYCGGLTTLKGAPETVGGCLYCKRCKNLKIADSERKKYKIRDLM